MPMPLTQLDTAAGAGTQGGRRPTIVPAPAAVSPEISGRPRRRTFTVQDKLRILAETDRAADTGQIGAILRREGLYSSMLGDWRRQREAGAIGALLPARRGPKIAEPNPFAAELALSQKDNARLTLRLARAEAIIELQKKVADLLHAPRFADQAPAEIYATLLDEGDYHCSIRTMYRLLNQNHEVRERRAQLRHPVYQKPELLAEGPNQVWSWDITKLKGPAKWSYFYLYVILDIYSRRVVGWCVADSESAVLFKALFDDTITKHDVIPGQLTLHADRGGPMQAKATALLLSDLGVTRSHNRPHTSNDNPFSESHFKTLKYQPQFPQRFGCIEDAKSFCRHFFDWYNRDHHHAGIGLMTPDQVHYCQADAVHTARQLTLDQAFRDNPERFVNKPPIPPAKPTAAWINPPTPKAPERRS